MLHQQGVVSINGSTSVRVSRKILKQHILWYSSKSCFVLVRFIQDSYTIVSCQAHLHDGQSAPCGCQVPVHLRNRLSIHGVSSLYMEPTDVHINVVYIYIRIYTHVHMYIYIYYTHKTNMHMSITDSLMKYKPRKYLKIWTRNMEKNRDSQFIQTLKVLDTFRLLESKHRCKLGWRLLHWHPLPVTIGNTYTCASEVKTCQNIH